MNPWRAMFAEKLRGVLQQLTRDGDIDQCGMNALVAKVGGEVRQPWLRIDTLSVPVQHPMHNERVAKIVYARADTPAGRLEFRATEYID